MKTLSEIVNEYDIVPEAATELQKLITENASIGYKLRELLRELSGIAYNYDIAPKAFEKIVKLVFEPNETIVESEMQFQGMLYEPGEPIQQDIPPPEPVWLGEEE